MFFDDKQVYLGVRVGTSRFIEIMRSSLQVCEIVRQLYSM